MEFHKLTPDAQPLELSEYMLELPFDVGLPDGFLFHAKDNPDFIEEGWEDFSLPDFYCEPDNRHLKGALTSTTLIFRTVERREPLAVEAIQRVYPKFFERATVGDCVRALYNWTVPSRRYNYKSQIIFSWFPFRLMPRDIARGPKVQRTVVKIMRIAPTDFEPNSQDRVADNFSHCQMVLNQYLQSVQYIASDTIIDVVKETSLPSVSFYRLYNLNEAILHSRRIEQYGRLGSSSSRVLTAAKITYNQAEAASTIANSDIKTGLTAKAFLDEAFRAFARSEYRYAAIESGTSVEMLVSDVIRECAPLLNYSPEKTLNILQELSFANCVKDHYATKILNYSSDVLTSSDALGVWWRKGYLLRNKVVHEGHEPHKDEVSEALSAADYLFTDTLLRIRNHEKLRETEIASSPMHNTHSLMNRRLAYLEEEENYSFWDSNLTYPPVNLSKSPIIRK